jgi:hypothetical protein
MKTTKSISLALGLAGLFVALATVLSPLVHADESDYITDVSLNGTPVGPATLPLGHAICYDISAHGVAGVEHESQLAISSGVSSHDFATIVVQAVYDMCPSNIPALNAWEMS